MSLYIVSRKFNYPFDCSFFVVDGGLTVETTEMNIGDSVVLLFNINEEKFEAIGGLQRNDVEAFSGLGGGDYSVHIRFRVKERRHALAWRSVGNLQKLGIQIYLEAENGFWEDIFCWVCLGEQPAWAE